MSCLQHPRQRHLPRPHRNRLQQTQPIPRVGTPGEIGGIALYLASDESSFVTGVGQTSVCARPSASPIWNTMATTDKADFENSSHQSGATPSRPPQPPRAPD
ncbi:MAG: SDR family oxidoreductase [Acidimicrobiia bacterium]|nr:SDR family oxidoreductase [Acidimicrobiia bacterium]